MKQNKMSTRPRADAAKRVATDAALLAAALMISRIESLLPMFLPIPGFKPGLANIAVTLAVCLRGKRDGFAVMTLRTLISSLLFGSFTSFAFSFAGGTLSFLVTAALARRALRRDAKISLVGVSILAAAAHGIGQVLAACIVFGGVSPLGTLWWMLLMAVPTGALTGYISRIITERLGIRNK